MSQPKTVLLGVTGSIAAYKSAELVRLLQKKGLDVRVIMTEGATKFITPLTLQTLSRNPVGVQQFDLPAEWSPEHISFAQQADILLIAPCTANVIAKLSYGMADDLLTATALATRAPLYIAPAMNDGMWDHPAVQENLTRLRERGAVIIEPETGDLACGTQGKGRLADLKTIISALPLA